MKNEQYEKIFEENLKQLAVKVGLGRHFEFQHDNDPRHTSYLVKNYLLKAKITTLDWSSQSDLNLIENVWGELKSPGSCQKTIKFNLQQLEQFAKEEWAKIPVDRCLQLVANYPKRLLDVIQQKGHTINYWGTILFLITNKNIFLFHQTFNMCANVGMKFTSRYLSKNHLCPENDLTISACMETLSEGAFHQHGPGFNI